MGGGEGGGGDQEMNKRQVCLSDPRLLAKIFCVSYAKYASGLTLSLRLYFSTPSLAGGGGGGVCCRPPSLISLINY